MGRGWLWQLSMGCSAGKGRPQQCGLFAERRRISRLCRSKFTFLSAKFHSSVRRCCRLSFTSTACLMICFCAACHMCRWVVGLPFCSVGVLGGLLDDQHLPGSFWFWSKLSGSKIRTCNDRRVPAHNLASQTRISNPAQFSSSP